MSQRDGGRRERKARTAAWGAAVALLAAALPAAPLRAQARPAGVELRWLSGLGIAGAARLLADTVAARMLAVTRDPDGVAVANVVVRLRAAGPAGLARHGARVDSRVGTLVNARVPLDSLAAVAADPAIAAVYPAQRWAPYNDLGTAAIGVASLRQATGPDTFTGDIGRGVIIGLVDTGVDYGHPDFRLDAADQSRILYLWDQTLSGGPAPGLVDTTTFGYGTECRQAALSAGTCPETDDVGHGTHVLGTAAGDGSATGGVEAPGKYAGVAPGAELIVVKTTFLSTAVVDGVNYIFSRAAQLGLPAVVNLSLGSEWGPHDGTLPEEEELDSLEGPGRIVVAAVGNAGANGNTVVPPATPPDHWHAEAAVPLPGQQVDFQIAVPSYQPLAGSDNDFIVPQLWYDHADTVTVTVIRPDGSTVSVGTTGDTAVAQDAADGGVIGQNASGSAIALTRDNLGLFVLGDFNGGQPPAPGTWTIRVTGVASRSGRPMHLWISEGTLGAGASLAGVTLLTDATNGYLVGTPATATRVLAAAAFTTRLQWTDVAGQTEGYSVPVRLGDLASFSSPGPRRDGVLKPDLAAPGQGIASSLSSAATVPQGRILPDGRHWILEGTSMAAPFVTGAVALLLEHDPRLTPEQARTLLTGTARADSFTVRAFDGSAPMTPNASWGYGKLFVPGALSALTSSAAGQSGQINFSENPVRGPSVIMHYPGAATRVAIFDFAGNLVRSFPAPPVGRLQWDLSNGDGRPVVNGVYVVVVNLGASTLRRRLFVARRAGP